MFPYLQSKIMSNSNRFFTGFSKTHCSGNNQPIRTQKKLWSLFQSVFISWRIRFDARSSYLVIHWKIWKIMHCINSCFDPFSHLVFDIYQNRFFFFFDNVAIFTVKSSLNQISSMWDERSKVLKERKNISNLLSMFIQWASEPFNVM